MKNFYTTLILTLVLSLSASAHNPFKTKKTTKQQVETRNASLRNLLPIGNSLPDSAYITNRYGEIDNKIIYEFENNIVRELFYNRNYDDNNNSSSSWNINHRVVYSTDSIGRIRVRVEAYYNEESITKWESTSMETYSYHKGDKPYVNEYLVRDEGVWYTEQKTVYEYDDKDNIVGYTTYESQDVNGDGKKELVISEEAKCDYTIDAEGYLNYLIYFKDMQEAGADFELGIKAKLKYNDEHYLIYSEEAEWMDKQWGQSSKEEKVYKNGKLISDKNYNLAEDGTTWNMSEGTEYTYNTKGQLVKEVEYSSDYDTNEVYINSTKELFYTNSQSSIETGKADNNVKLSIVNGVLTVDSNQAETVSVYSITGVQLASFDKSEGQASISISDKGIIIVKGNSGWATKTISK